jgi:O-antigen ligase
VAIAKHAGTRQIGAALGVVGHRLVPRWMATGTLVVLATPLFVDGLSGRLLIINLFKVGAAEPNVLAIHLGVLVIPLVAALVLARRLADRRRLPKQPTSRYVAGLLLFFTISILAGVLVGRSSLALVFYAQTVIPLLAFFVGTQADLNIERLSGIVVGSVAVSAAVILIAVVTASTLESTRIIAVLVAAIPQYRNFFPAVLAIAIALAFSFRYVRPPLFTGALILFALLLPILWSRTGLAMIGLTAVISVYLNLRKRPTNHDTRSAGVVAGSIALTFLVGVIMINSSVVANRLDNIAVIGGQGDQNRLDKATTALGYVAENPLTGRSFRLEAEYLRERGEIETTFRSHNQYLDYALKAGVAGFLLLATLLIRSLQLSRKMWCKSTDRAQVQLGAAMTAVLVATSFGLIFHLLLVQSFSGSLFFFLLGYATSPSTPSSPRFRDSAAPRTVAIKPPK